MVMVIKVTVICIIIIPGLYNSASVYNLDTQITLVQWPLFSWDTISLNKIKDTWHVFLFP